MTFFIHPDNEVIASLDAADVGISSDVGIGLPQFGQLMQLLERDMTVYSRMWQIKTGCYRVDLSAKPLSGYNDGEDIDVMITISSELVEYWSDLNPVAGEHDTYTLWMPLNQLHEFWHYMPEWPTVGVTQTATWALSIAPRSHGMRN